MNGSMKESIELTEEIISKNLNEWQKQAKPYYTKTDYEELFGDDGLVATLPSFFKSINLNVSGARLKKGIDTSLSILEKASTGNIDEARKLYNEYGRFDERISYLEEFISRSLYVPELMNCLERDWLLSIKHFPWQADESMVELKQLQQKVQTILDERKSKSSSTPMGMNG